MEFICGDCFTNLDGYDCSLVKKFVVVPKKGDNVEVLRNGSTTSLKVVSITHAVRKGMHADVEPFIKVELNKSLL